MKNFVNTSDLDVVLLKHEFACELLKTELNILIKEFEFNNMYNPVDHITSRIKDIESIKNKLIKKGYEYNAQNVLDHVHDIVGIRIVCPFMQDVYKIVEMIKKTNYFSVTHEKDYIKNPKNTGYLSYHLIVKVPIYLDSVTEYVESEIQVRTMAMDFWASIDHKIHYKYESTPDEVKEELFNYSKEIMDLDRNMDELNNKIKKYEKSIRK